MEKIMINLLQLFMIIVVKDLILDFLIKMEILLANINLLTQKKEINLLS